ncbi:MULTISPECIES: hypothetical protein [unclassified Acidovorax]|uniref:hypothetical protein n=1 Tax=unclassified Acidovorax TaxID=2684926 RepID=UPI001C4687D7|nr:MULTISPECIES: hypothetical protein [unclassified Acidovorax]MBV7459841.1 hypothetical protein [Acidovorax sp. sif0632]MBV7464866.1 hypothetical protein [Acidovorax sp. sif0613]
MKLKVNKQFDFAHRGCEVKTYPKGEEIDTDTADPELVRVATEEGWIGKPNKVSREAQEKAEREAQEAADKAAREAQEQAEREAAEAAAKALAEQGAAGNGSGPGTGPADTTKP